jgi:hypothetical protein
VLPSAPLSNLEELKSYRMTSGYEFDDQTLSLDDSIALTVRRPPKNHHKMSGFGRSLDGDASGELAGDPATNGLALGGCLRLRTYTMS